jgi:hypothetical protein
LETDLLFDYVADVKKYSPDVDEAAVKGIETYLGKELEFQDQVMQVLWDGHTDN